MDEIPAIVAGPQVVRPALAMRSALFMPAVAVIVHPAQAQEPARWNGETPTGPTKTLFFETTEGIWNSLSISPDGRSIAFDLRGHIYEMLIKCGTARRLTNGLSWNLFPRYSPNGRSIAFSSDRSGSHNIWIIRRQGAGLRNVTMSSTAGGKPEPLTVGG